MYLPITTSLESDPPVSDLKSLPTGEERILFVDDEKPIREMNTRVLEGLGYHLTVTDSSTDALARFQMQPDRFDLVISDMTMPGLTGDKLALALLNIRSDIPIIICTGYSKHLTEQRAVELGIKAFIFKPIRRRELAVTVRRVLDMASPMRPLSDAPVA